jgi:hypothetical protein
MLYSIDWSDTSFPRIQSTGSAYTGDTLDVVVIQVIRHHIEVIRAHCQAMERMINEVSS